MNCSILFEKIFLFEVTLRTLGSLGKLVNTLTTFTKSNIESKDKNKKIISFLIEKILDAPNNLKEATDEHLSLFLNNLNKWIHWSMLTP